MCHSLYFPSFNDDWHSGKNRRFILVFMCVCARAWVCTRACIHGEEGIQSPGVTGSCKRLIMGSGNLSGGCNVLFPWVVFPALKMQFFKKCLLLNIQKTEFSDMLSRSLTGCLWKFKCYFLTHKEWERVLSIDGTFIQSFIPQVKTWRKTTISLGSQNDFLRKIAVFWKIAHISMNTIQGEAYYFRERSEWVETN